MKKLQVILRLETVEDVKEALSAIGIGGATLMEVRGFGRQRGHTEIYRSRKMEVDFRSKMMLEIVMEDEKVDDADKKSIYVTVRRRGGMAEIRIENYTPRVPDFAEGLPVTTKDDAENHGFGMLSMRSIAKRYGGSLRASVSDDIFTLLVLIPLK